MSCARRIVYKVQVWMLGDDTIGQKNHFRDYYLDVSEIIGFYIPDNIEELQPDKAVNIVCKSGEVDTIKQEPHILDYLKKEFVDKAIDSIKKSTNEN